MKLATHMPDGERRKPIDIEVCRTKDKVTTFKNRTKIRYFFVSAQYLILNKFPSAQRHKIHIKYIVCLSCFMN
jgi:hypothetical protein